VRSLINCVFANIMNATNESERRRFERHGVMVGAMKEYIMICMYIIYILYIYINYIIHYIHIYICI